MPSTMHIIRTAHDGKALKCIRAQAEEGNASLLLIGEGVQTTPPQGTKTYVLREGSDDAPTEGEPHPVSYDELVTLLFEYDTVVVW